MKIIKEKKQYVNKEKRKTGKEREKRLMFCHEIYIYILSLLLKCMSKSILFI